MLGCRTTEATDLGFVCFAVLNHRVFLASRVDFGFFCFINFPVSLPSEYGAAESTDVSYDVSPIDLIFLGERELIIKHFSSPPTWNRNGAEESTLG